MAVVAYDTETTGLYAHHGAEMFSFSLTDRASRSSVHRLDGSQVRQYRSQRKLEELWAEDNKALGKTAHNLKFDLQMTEKRLGRQLNGHHVHCTHKMSHILQNHHHGHSLDNLGWELAEYPRIDGRIKRLAKLSGGYDKVPERDMTKYQIADTERGMLLYLFFWPKIKANPEWHAIYDMEIELIWTTMRVEERGLMVRRAPTLKMIGELEQETDEAREKLYDLVGHRFNVDSPPQLRQVLYRDLGLPVLKKTRKSREASTDKHVLAELKEKFNHPVLNMILKVRAYSKGITNLESYLELADGDDIVRPTINTCTAITARESSEHPNLQNVAKSEVLLNPFPVPARRAFGPRPGFVNIHIDYAGIEGRLLVNESGDEEMLDCIINGDGDIHSLASSALYVHADCWAKAVLAERQRVIRNACKNANFAAPYGAGDHKVAATAGLRGAAARAGVKEYRRRFPKYVGLNKTIAARVMDEGYVTTAFGRRMHVPKNEAYIGTNYLIQCTAAGVLKRAQNRVEKYNQEATGGEVSLLIPIHDEIVIQYPRARLSELPGYLRDVRVLMIDFPQFKVPLEIEAEVSTVCWEEKKALEVPK